MVQLNPNYDKLAAGYLFAEIERRTRKFQEQDRGVKVLKLGIGNTTEPLTPKVLEGLRLGVSHLANVDTYTGYGVEQGDDRLRKALANRYSRRGVDLSASEIFVSDGAKPDSANIQSIFSLDSVVAVQDPSYPVYVDTNVIAGRTGSFNEGTRQYRGIVYMPCTEENGFSPDLPKQKTDLIYLCSPNNPTGAVMTRESLEGFVEYARKHKSVIIFDAAYSAFISDPSLPRSLYEIEGAKECAIEINSFSKDAGFTGVRLGWTVVPEDLVVEGTRPRQVNDTWNRRQSTFFNGASNIVQQGGLAALSETGQSEIQKLVDYYMGNAGIIRQGLQDLGITFYGGVNAPYIWMKTPGDRGSLDFFDKLLQETHVVGTPGAGFGPSGEGFFRLSAFNHRDVVEEAVQSIKDNLKL